MKAVTDWNSIESVSRLATQQEATLGSMNPQLAETLAQLADLYFLAEDYINAESIYWRVLTIRQKALGECHPDTAAALQSLAELYEIQDRYAEAQRFYKWATSVKKSAMLKMHSDRLDATVVKEVEPKLPQISDLQDASCRKCGRKLLDSTVCMYCTQGSFNAAALLKKAQEMLTPNENGGPVNKLSSEDGTEQYKLDEHNIVIGRHPSNQIVFADDKHVSRHHAKLQFIGGDFVLVDNGSANGTYVNGQRIQVPTKLKSGDVILMGSKKLIDGFGK